jgi:hypothetical protein
VKLAIRSVLGEEVSVLVNEVRTAGVYVVDFDARNLTSGVYIATLESDGRSISRKMLLVK